MPTHSAADVQRKITPPNIVELSGKDLKKVILTLKGSEPFFRNPQEQKRDLTQVKLDRIGSYEVAYIRWLIEGTGPLEVSVRTVKGGRASKSLP